MFSCEGSGRTVEKAIEDALLQLRVSRDDVDIKVLDTGGLFRKAKVFVEISDDCKEQYRQRKEKLQKLLEEEVGEDVKGQNVQEKPKQSNNEPKVKIEKHIDSNPKQEKNIAPCKQEKTDAKAGCDCKNEVAKKSDKKQSQAEIGKKFLEGFLKSAHIDGQVGVDENEEEIFYTITGQNISNIIGYRGECLNSLQFLVSVIVGKNDRKCKRVRLDADGYRERRKMTLTNLADRTCKKVEKTGHNSRLEPMSAYERRIIHTFVADNYPDLESVSKGEEPHRYLIIKKK